MSEERRQSLRCPVCQGPVAVDEKTPAGRCRNSLCEYNHENVECPRCKGRDIKALEYKDGAYKYKCSDCINIWQSVAKY